MIIIFDLDDTLYEEISFVKGGIKSVAGFLEKEYMINYEYSYKQLSDILFKFGRGKIFDIFLKNEKIFSKSLTKKCINIYRSHEPNIKLYKSAIKILEKFRPYNIYLVTDGNKLVQARKVKSLNIEKYFKRIFITHRYGIKNSKPSLHCFNLIKKIEDCNWSDLVYIGDNPSKDFISLNKIGAKTIRLSRGPYANINAKEGYDANVSIKDLAELPKALNLLFN